MRRTASHPDQLPLGFGKDAEIERMIERGLQSVPRQRRYAGGSG